MHEVVVIAMVAVALVLAVVCCVAPAWLRGSILVLDIVWVGFLIAIVTWFNPEGARSWSSQVAIFITTQSAPIVAVLMLSFGRRICRSFWPE